MTQNSGFANNLVLPVTVVKGGSGTTTSTGTTACVLSQSARIVAPVILGITNASTPSAGNIGELLKSEIAIASAISLSSNTTQDVTSLSVTAGLWLLFGNVTMTGSNGQKARVWINTVSATLPTNNIYNEVIGAAVNLFSACGQSVPNLMVNISGTTTYYLSIFSLFTSTATACGNIYALRMG